MTELSLELTLTEDQVRIGAHEGPYGKGIEYLRRAPSIKAQLDKIDPDQLRQELRRCHAWDEEELSDHEANLNRVLNLACSAIYKGMEEKYNSHDRHSSHAWPALH